MKRCPFCAEEIQDEAVKCKHCGSFLDDRASQSGPETISGAHTRRAGSETSGDPMDIARTVPANTLSVGAILAAQYRILDDAPVGSGGMGEVWRAEDTELGTPVAIKVLPAVLARDRVAVEGLKREALIGRQLSHANICRLYAMHSNGALKFLVMEYVAGQTLAELLAERQDHKLSWKQLKPIALQIAGALDYAHEVRYEDASGRRVKGILHRDIKPQNIMVTADGTAKLMDFGIAREIRDTMTRVTGRTSQTPLYASPEQFRGEPLTTASDIFSFAAVLYECLAGHPLVSPHGDLAWQILHRPFEPLEGHPEGVNRMLKSGLAQVAKDRPASGKALMDLSRPPVPRPKPAPPRSQPDSTTQKPAARDRKASASPPHSQPASRCTQEPVRRKQAASASPPRSPSKSRSTRWAVVGVLAGLATLIVAGAILAVVGTRNTNGTGETARSSTSEIYGTWPFDSREASRRQQETARALGIPKEQTLDCGNGVKMKLVLIPAGTFVMGSRDSAEEVARKGGGKAEWYEDEHPRHSVTITEPFYMGATEVTQAQYEAVTGENPSYFKGRENPVERVSWNDATAFCRKLATKTGRTVRLPTEAEWEYACRAGTSTPFHTGETISTGQANYDGNYTYGNGRKGAYRKKTVEVGSFRANAFGLYDMHGNVWEWCADWYQDSYRGLGDKDPKGPNNGSHRVLRGGSWSRYPWYCRSAYRFRSSPDVTNYGDGFRVVVAAGRVD